MRRLILILSALLIIAVVPTREFLEWRQEINGLVPESGRVTHIERRRCRGGRPSRSNMCSYGTIEYPLSADTIGVLTPSSPIPSRYQTGDLIPLLVDPKNREHVLLVDRGDKLFAFFGIPSLFAVAAFVTLLAASRFVPSKKHHGREG